MKKIKNNIENINETNKVKMKKILLPLGILIVLILSEIFMNKIDFLRYIDEFIAIFFGIYLMVNLIRRKIVFSKNIMIIVIISIVVTIIGIISNIVWNIQNSIFAILVDVLVNFKLIVCCIGFYYMINDNGAKNIAEILYTPAKIMIVLGFVFSIISLFIDIGMRGQLRFGIYGFNFIFEYAHIYSMMIIFCILIIFANGKGDLALKKYLFFAMFQMILTTKGPSIIWSFAVIVLLFYMKKRSKINIKLLLILFTITILLGQYQINNYFIEAKAPRATLYKYSVITAMKYFPLGSGFATYGSDMAAKYYSPLYKEYGFNNKPGMKQNDIRFLNDNYWPLILGQFGIFGVVGFLIIVYIFFNIIQNMKIKSNIKAIIFSAYFYTILISLGTSIYTTSATIIMFLGIIIAWKTGAESDENKKNDNSDFVLSIKRAIIKGDLLKKIFCLFLIKIGFSNFELQAIEIRNKKFNKCKKKYEKYLNMIEYPKDEEKKQTNKNVWILWLQGEENEPEIVKKCIESIKFYMNDCNINILTLENISDYIKLPEYIIKKWKDGIITNTHLSDIIRTELLIKYGGTWIDATTYLTGPIPDYVYRNNIFMYRCKYSHDKTITYNSWLIYAEKNNRLLKATRDLLYEYWKKEKKLKEYFLWHFFMTMVIEKYKKDADKIPYCSDEMSHMIQYVLLNKYDKNYWKDIINITNVHKLTYKLDLSQDICNTYYEFILNSEIGEKNE